LQVSQDPDLEAVRNMRRDARMIHVRARQCFSCVRQVFADIERTGAVVADLVGKAGEAKLREDGGRARGRPPILDPARQPAGPSAIKDESNLAPASASSFAYRTLCSARALPSWDSVPACRMMRIFVVWSIAN